MIDSIVTRLHRVLIPPRSKVEISFVSFFPQLMPVPIVFEVRARSCALSSSRYFSFFFDKSPPLLREKSLTVLPSVFRFYFFPRNAGYFCKDESLFLRRLSRNANFFLNLHNHTFSCSRNFLVPLMWSSSLRLAVGVPPELGDRP